jgi:hypothetical protein
MPNRILREGINSSDRIDKLSEGAELFYRRLMSVVDDYGRFSGDARIIRSSAYPLRTDRISLEQIESWLKESARHSVGLIKIYHSGHKRYIELVDFKQQIRAKSKWPDPPDSELRSSCVAIDSNCTLYSESESESESESKTESFIKPCASGDAPVSAPEPRFELRAEEPSKHERERWFDEEFWPNVWAKIGRGAARKAWMVKVRTPEIRDLAIVAARAQKQRILDEASRRGGGVLHPSTWINAERWADEHPDFGSPSANGKPSFMKALEGMTFDDD